MVESESASVTTGANYTLEKDIEYLLNRADLQKHREAFIRSGVLKVKNFMDFGDDKLEKDVGLSKMEVQLLRRNLNEIQAESKESNNDSTGKFLYYQKFSILFMFWRVILELIKYTTR